MSLFIRIGRPKIRGFADHGPAMRKLAPIGITGTALISMVPFFRNANALEFEVHGRLVHTFHGFGTSDVKPYTNYANFSVFVRECQWLIQSTNSRFGAAERSSAGPVGEDVALVLGFDSSSQRSSSRQARLARIWSLPIPRFAEAYEISPIWYAYASACYLKAASAPNLEQINALGASGINPWTNHIVRAFLDYDAHGTGLPSYTAWLTSSGTTNAVFSRTFLGTNRTEPFPVDWTFRVYSSDGKLMHTYETISASYSQKCSLQRLDPPIGGDGLETLVVDHRFAQDARLPIERVVYPITTQWPTREQLMETKWYRDAAGIAESNLSHRQHAARTNSMRRVVLIGWFITSGIAFWVWRGPNTKKAKTTK